MTHPHAFHGAPRLTPGPQPQPARVVQVPAKLPRVVPLLTVYEDGRVNPNREADLLLNSEGLCFFPPPAVRPGCTPRFWEVAAGDCHLFCRAAEHTYLRAAGRCPPPGKYLFTPLPSSGRYALVPVG